MLLKDGVVAAHFSDFRVARSRLVDLKGDKEAYVSYRIGDKVYWTKKRVRLAKGEKLITDGINYARSRCGNRISEVSQAPTSAEEPTHALLDMPIPTDEKDPLLLGAMPKPAGGLPDQMHPSASGFMPGSKSRLPGFLIPGVIGGGAVAGRVFGSGGGDYKYSCSTHCASTKPIANCGRSGAQYADFLGFRIRICNCIPKTDQKIRVLLGFSGGTLPLSGWPVAHVEKFPHFGHRNWVVEAGSSREINRWRGNW